MTSIMSTLRQGFLKKKYHIDIVYTVNHNN